MALATAFTFSGVLHNGWVFLDDPHYVYENPHVNRGLTAEGLRWSLHGPHGGNWHPLTSLSHLLDVEFFGLEPRGHHAVSLALHVANALLVLIVLARLSGEWWRSAFVAALFALHPLRVESVAWVSERKDVLCAFFILLALGAHRLRQERPTRARGAAVLALSALALLSKPMAVTLPFVIVLLEVSPIAGRPARDGASDPLGVAIRRAIARWWPLFVLSAASAVVTFLVQRSSGAVMSVEHVPLGHRVPNALLSYWRYIGQTLWPSGLTVFYPYPRAPRPALALIAGIGLALVTWAALRQRRRPHLPAGWLWFAGMLVPVIGLVQVGGQAHADRYTYLPTIGLLIVIVWGAAELAERLPAGRPVLVGAAFAVLAALSVATARQVGLWKDTRTLFTHALAVTRDNSVAHLNMGDVLLREGNVEAAIPHFREAVRLAPRLAEPYNKLGAALGARGQNEEAIDLFRRALELGETAELRHNLGFALGRLARTEEAIPEYMAALRLDPDHVLSLVHLGEAFRAEGKISESEGLLRRAVETAPADPEARRSLAVTLILSGDVEEAIEHYAAILRAEPADLDALVNIAWIRATHVEEAARDAAVAVEMAERARAAAPEPVAVIEATAAAAYAEAGRFADAVAAGERAVALARGAGEQDAAARYVEQLEEYRRGRPFHFAP